MENTQKAKLLSEKTLIKKLIQESLEENGLVDPYITRSEIVKHIGRHRYDKAVRNGWLQIIKGEGRNSQIKVSRAIYRNLLIEGRI